MKNRNIIRRRDRMLKKLAAGSIVSALMITLLAACGSQPSTTKTASSASPSSAATTAATASATPAPSAKVDTLVIAYLPNEAKEELAQARSGLAKDLGAALGVNVKEFLGSDYNAV